VVLVVLVAAALVWHVTATVRYSASFDGAKTLAQRTDAAQTAARLEPFNATFAKRALVMRLWSHGALLLSQDAALPAMLQLADAYSLDVGDPQLLALFKQAQARLSLDSNFKAHIQHAHEGPGGTLRPQDLLR